MDMIFGTTGKTIWQELNIPQNMVKDEINKYFGIEPKIIDNQDEAIDLLLIVVTEIQNKMINLLKSESSELIILKLYKIFDDCFTFYCKEKRIRSLVEENNIYNEELINLLGNNRNIALNIISSVNLWLENCMLFQDNLDLEYSLNFSNIDKNLLIDMYIYGCSSQALSLITLSKKLSNYNLYYGLEIRPDKDVPIDPLRYHPVMYSGYLLAGNQKSLVEDIELKGASISDYGQGFKKNYHIDFIYALRIIKTFQYNYLNDGEYAVRIIPKSDFIDDVELFSSKSIKGSDFFNAFVLTKEKILSQKRESEPIVWKMGTNKYRHEIRPFLCLNNDKVIISCQALEQAKYIWCSSFLTGGIPYSNITDDFTNAVKLRINDLTKRLVENIRKVLQSNYNASFDEIDVKYDRIFGHREVDYGDYDIVFYSEEANELFLIEAKFFSDSLNSSGIITDFHKLFKDNGYYEHCRRRYDLVCQEPEKIKAFVETNNEKIAAHFLFVSSKPLEIEIQDKDGIVTFLSLNCFEQYLHGKILDEKGEKVIRPIHII